MPSPRRGSPFHSLDGAMNRITKFGTLGFLSAAVHLMAYGADVPPYSVDAPIPKEQCYLPLEAYCGRHPCLRYDDSVAQLKKEGASRELHPGCIAAHGKCGEWRFTRFGGSFADAIHYFDGAGTLVAVRTSSDRVRIPSNCPNWRHYGRPLSCSIEQAEDFCSPRRCDRPGR